MGCGRVIIQLSNCIPRFTAVVSNFGGRDYFLTSLPFLSVILSISVFPDYKTAWLLTLGWFIYTFLFVNNTGNVLCSTSSCYVSSGCHMCTLYETLVDGWNRFNFFNKLIEFCWVSIPVCYHKVETSSERYSLRYYDWVGTNTNRAILGMLYMVHDWLLTHIGDASRCKDEIWVVAFLLEDFESLASWVSVRSHALQLLKDKSMLHGNVKLYCVQTNVSTYEMNDGVLLLVSVPSFYVL